MFTFLKSDVAFKKIKTNQSVHQWGIGLQIIVNPYNFKNEKSKVQPFSLSLYIYTHTRICFLCICIQHLWSRHMW